MGKKVLFSFAGTGITAGNAKSDVEMGIVSPEVVRVYFSGCQDPKIGGITGYIGSTRLGLGTLGEVSPNLDVVASGIRQAFTAKDKGEEANIDEDYDEDDDVVEAPLPQLSLKKLKQHFGDAIIIEPESALKDEATVEVDSLFMKGFSRGAVTTFACARQLNELEIPMSILAIDPVPGDSRKNETNVDSEYAKNFDLSSCNNIQSADVLVGTYENASNSLENKYFRQMVPKLPEKATSTIYAVPKRQHVEWMQEQSAFTFELMHRKGIHTNPLTYSTESQQRLYPVPRVLQQKFHTGVVGRTQFLPAYKERVRDTLPASHETPKSFKMAQAYLALSSRYDMQNTSRRQLIVMASQPKNVAARDFIVEMDAILKYSIEPRVPDRPLLSSIASFLGREYTGQQYKQAIELHDDLVSRGDEYNKAVSSCLREVDSILHEFSQIESPTLAQCQTFDLIVLDKVASLKGSIPAKCYAKVHQAVQSYLDEAPLTHPGLAQFIDEKETFETLPSQANNRAHDATAVMDIHQLTSKLYHSSKKQRSNVYQAHKQQLPSLIKTVSDIADIVQFLTKNNLHDMLSQKAVTDQITSVADICVIMRHAPSYEHRKVLLKAIDIKNLPQPDPAQLKELTRYLSETKQQQVAQVFGEITAKDKVDPVVIRQEELSDPLMIDFDDLEPFSERSAAVTDKPLTTTQSVAVAQGAVTRFLNLFRANAPSDNLQNEPLDSSEEKEDRPGMSM